MTIMSFAIDALMADMKNSEKDSVQTLLNTFSHVEDTGASMQIITVIGMQKQATWCDARHKSYGVGEGKGS